MKAIVKFVAPATLALAAFSANAAGIVETDYPVHQGSASAAVQPASGSAVEYGLSWTHSEAAPVDTRAYSAEGPSREQVQRQAAEPRKFDVGYFA